MKLYFSPGACSMASHIVLHEIGGPFDIERVDTVSKRTASGTDFRTVNPKGKVPALALAGEVLTEGPSILQFLADRAANEQLAPRAGTMARARVNELLNFTGTELHVAFHPLFDPAATDAARAAARDRVGQKFGWLEDRLSDGRRFLTGDTFTIADAYAFVVCNWAGPSGIDLGKWPRLQAFAARVAARPATIAAMRAEGLAA